jgi:hypothetical protein
MWVGIVIGFVGLVLLLAWALCVAAKNGDLREAEMFQLQKYCSRCPHKEAERRAKALALFKQSAYMSDELKRPSVKGGTA